MSSFIDAVKKFNKTARDVRIPNVWAMPRHYEPGTKTETYEYRLVKALQGGKGASSVPKKLPTGGQQLLPKMVEEAKKKKEEEEEAKKKAMEEAMKPKRSRKKKNA